MAEKPSAGHNIGELLLREGLITEAQLDSTLARRRETDLPLVRLLVENGYLEETRRMNFFKRHFGVPIVSLGTAKIDALLYSYIPGVLAKKHRCVPIKLDRDGLVVAMEDPSDLVFLDNLKEIAGVRVKPVVASSAEILEALDGYPQPQAIEVAKILPDKFDPVARFMTVAFWPLMSSLVLAGIAALIVYSEDTQKYVQNLMGGNTAARSSQVFSLFLYFFLSWGIWTLIMFEVGGLVFDDLSWREEKEVGPEKVRGKAILLSILGGWLGLDRLYLGYKRMGILKLCTLGLLGIWWLADAFFLVTGSVPDAAGRRLVAKAPQSNGAFHD
ncbi:MAG: NINE protein [Candidatus Sumerlaeaceae bacterium]|nr:NINE protein [Candidatus Sumerlaeaceae bacterium]